MQSASAGSLLAYKSTLKGGALHPLPREARSRFPIRPLDFLTHVLLLDRGKLGVFALEALSVERWSSRSGLSEPRRIPLPCAFENPLDDVVLVRVRDRRDDSHLLAAARAELGFDLPDLDDQARPILSAKPDELRVLLDGDDVGGRCARTLSLLVHPAKLPANASSRERRRCRSGTRTARRCAPPAWRGTQGRENERKSWELGALAASLHR